MLFSGLTSITFRDLTVSEIIKITKEAGLDAIEWGGDIHVPHGDIKNAQAVGMITRKAGLKVPSYGSYYSVGCPNQEIGSFKRVLKTTVALGAKVIRVWAGDRGSRESDGEWRKKVVMDSQRIASIAEKENIQIGFEYHDDTLTDTDQSALKLLQDINRPNVGSYWQPPHKLSEKERTKSLQGILKYLNNIHVFYWTEPGQRRHSLKKASSSWKKYFTISSQTGRDHYAFLEFVKGDSIEQFYKDAAELKEILNAVNRDLIS